MNYGICSNGSRDTGYETAVRVAQIIADLGGNVTSVHHERANEGSDVNGCYLRIILETKNYEHIEEIKKGLIAEGFKLL